ncbi:hypothetical protein D3C73_1184480 [compost metagenome]
MVGADGDTQQQAQGDQGPGGRDPELPEGKYREHYQDQHVEGLAPEFVSEQPADETAEEHADQRGGGHQPLLQFGQLQGLAQLHEHHANDAEDVPVEKWRAGGVERQLLVKTVERRIFQGKFELVGHGVSLAAQYRTHYPSQRVTVPVVFRVCLRRTSAFRLAWTIRDVERNIALRGHRRYNGDDALWKIPLLLDRQGETPHEPACQRFARVMS